MFALLVVCIFSASETQRDLSSFSLIKLNTDCAIGDPNPNHPRLKVDHLNWKSKLFPLSKLVPDYITY